MVQAILWAGSLVVWDLTYWIEDACSDSFYRLKRLLHHLVCPRGDLHDALTGTPPKNG